MVNFQNGVLVEEILIILKLFSPLSAVINNIPNWIEEGFVVNSYL